jgi:hypothetical protein
MELIVQLFRHKYNERDNEYTKQRKIFRQLEYDFCFQTNVRNPLVNKMHIFVENTDDINEFIRLAENNTHKLTFIHFGKQPHYKDFIEYIQTSIPDNRVACIMNGDLFIDPQLKYSYIEKYIQGTTMFGLTRHELTDEKHSVCNIDTCNLIHNYWGSADVFLMRTPIVKTIPLEKINFKQNVFGAENIFQKTLKEAGYTILNPCHQIRTFHVHRHRAYFQEYETIGNHLDFNEPPSYLTD